ncbi:MAG: hypothetical protein JWP78_337 [Mucilaginibacter sp.]|nr:hypothetical protein [Mucilaginibacter sp.]
MDQADTTANDSVPRTFWHTTLLCCGIAGSLLFNIIYFSFGAISADYDMMRQPIGDLELIRHGWIQSANCIVAGLLICAFAVGLHKEMVRGFGSISIPLVHVLTAFGLILTGTFIHPPVHTLVSIITLALLMISFLLFARRFAGDTRWKGWTSYSLFTIVLMLLLLFVFLNAQSSNGPYAGVFERLIVVARLVWSILFILKLLGGRRLAPEGVPSDRPR